MWMCSKPVAIPKKMPKKGRRTTPRKYKTIVLLDVPTGETEYQAIISKLGGIILRYDIHATGNSDPKPSYRCVKTKPKNWLTRQLSRYEYQKLDEMRKKLQEELRQSDAQMIGVSKPWEESRKVKQPPYFKTEYQAAYGP